MSCRRPRGAGAELVPVPGAEPPELLRLLVRRLAEPELQGARLSALAVAAIARITTVDLLRAVLPDSDAEAAYERLWSLTFTEPLGDGLTLHELVRKGLRADFRRRDPDRERELRRRIVDYLYDRAREGDPLVTIDMAHLIDNATIKWGFGWEGSVDYRIDDVRPGDAEQIEELAVSYGFERWWTLTRPFSGAANPRFAYMPINPEIPGALEFAAALGAKHLEPLGFELGDVGIECHRIDYGPGGLIAAQRDVVYSELGLPSPRREGEAGPEVDAESIRVALRNFQVPNELARSPLANGAGPEERAESVRGLLRDAAEHAFGESENERLLRRVLVCGYIEPSASHEQAALDLSLSRAAYFRRLRVASERVAEYVLQNGG